MKYSKATNYALHTMVYLLLLPKDSSIGVHSLANLQKLSPTYLSKILGKLSKGGLIDSSPGVSGGYRIAKNPEKISFLDVIQLIEGNANLFHCSIHYDERCLIENVMVTAEQQMADELANRFLIDVAREMEPKVTAVLQENSHCSD
ncbi:Rrf2 family transcriptional regulator [Vagococcus sp. BWB3-3]|uniref:Rrf2 family transcriptional regulator n=1 Tax=Vagococcus allomyrinae TaxID=2794353 RepID=A0A940P863_9ENTE|nr:Rrf2 family transcriptional regulator [Vagococcus allomyrinae]MBP1039722.1 Rrf2 family transcriptional regulator [Vagococcus allomyrinae]